MPHVRSPAVACPAATIKWWHHLPLARQDRPDVGYEDAHHRASETPKVLPEAGGLHPLPSPPSPPAPGPIAAAAGSPDPGRGPLGWSADPLSFFAGLPSLDGPLCRHAGSWEELQEELLAEANGMGEAGGAHVCQREALPQELWDGMGQGDASAHAEEDGCAGTPYLSANAPYALAALCGSAGALSLADCASISGALGFGSSLGSWGIGLDTTDLTATAASGASCAFGEMSTGDESFAAEYGIAAIGISDTSGDKDAGGVGGCALARRARGGGAASAVTHGSSRTARPPHHSRLQRMASGLHISNDPIGCAVVGWRSDDGSWADLDVPLQTPAAPVPLPAGRVLPAAAGSAHGPPGTVTGLRLSGVHHGGESGAAVPAFRLSAHGGGLVDVGLEAGTYPRVRPGPHAAAWAWLDDACAVPPAAPDALCSIAPVGGAQAGAVALEVSGAASARRIGGGGKGGPWAEPPAQVLGPTALSVLSRRGALPWALPEEGGGEA